MYYIMSSSTGGPGRFCNQVFRTIALSVIAEKNNLKVNSYACEKELLDLGVILFNGTEQHNNTARIHDENYLNLFNSPVKKNLDFHKGFFQNCNGMRRVEKRKGDKAKGNSEVSNHICRYLRTEKQIQSVMNKNPFKERYKNNNDLFVHIRLGDIYPKYSLSMDYYIESIEKISFKDLYIASDSLNSKFIKKLLEKYPKAILVDKDKIETIHFGTTCKHVLLSHGTYSAIIGYLSYFSSVYYPECKTVWSQIEIFRDKGMIPMKSGDTPEPPITNKN